MDQKTAPLQELSAHPGPAGVHRAHSSCSGYFAGLFDIDPQPWNSAGHRHPPAGTCSSGIRRKVLDGKVRIKMHLHIDDGDWLEPSTKPRRLSAYCWHLARFSSNFTPIDDSPSKGGKY